MKSICSLILLVFALQISSAQTSYDIDGSSNVVSQISPVSDGKITVNMINFDTKLQYEINVQKKNLSIDVLATPAGFAAMGAGATSRPIGQNELEKNERLVVDIKAYDISGGTRTLKTNHVYAYETKRRGEWRTTFGFNFIYKFNQDTYFSKSNDDGTYSITEGRNRDKFDFHPTLMFTWLSNKHLDKKMNWNFGLSGGLGYDFDESLAVFVGPSFIYNENITFTCGVAFHNQNRLTSNYNEGDVISENLTFDQLHTEYIRVNPFVSISLRLDRNPFQGEN